MVSWSTRFRFPRTIRQGCFTPFHNEFFLGWKIKYLCPYILCQTLQYCLLKLFKQSLKQTTCTNFCSLLNRIVFSFQVSIVGGMLREKEEGPILLSHHLDTEDGGQVRENLFGSSCWETASQAGRGGECQAWAYLRVLAQPQEG